jgi:hypothetical protein
MDGPGHAPEPPVRGSPGMTQVLAHASIGPQTTDRDTPSRVVGHDHPNLSPQRASWGLWGKTLTPALCAPPSDAPSALLKRDVLARRKLSMPLPIDESGNRDGASSFWSDRRRVSVCGARGAAPSR